MPQFYLKPQEPNLLREMHFVGRQLRLPAIVTMPRSSFYYKQQEPDLLNEVRVAAALRIKNIWGPDDGTLRFPLSRRGIIGAPLMPRHTPNPQNVRGNETLP